LYVIQRRWRGGRRARAEREVVVVGPPSIAHTSRSLPLSRLPLSLSLGTPSLDAQGEITTKAKVDYEAIVRKTAREIGFTSEDVGLNADTCKVREERERGE